MPRVFYHQLWVGIRDIESPELEAYAYTVHVPRACGHRKPENYQTVHTYPHARRDGYFSVDERAV